MRSGRRTGRSAPSFTVRNRCDLDPTCAPVRQESCSRRALGLIVLGCLWFWFAPVPLGGSTTYVVTRGISMEPRFHTGDLALVRSQSSYHVGEIVAYHSKMLHTIVLHRIIGRAGARYVFKGDNNNFIDPEHPVASQLVGALWLHIPGAGADLQSLRSPMLIGALVAVGVLLLTGVAFTRRRRLRRRQRRSGEAAPVPVAAPAAALRGACPRRLGDRLRSRCFRSSCSR